MNKKEILKKLVDKTASGTYVWKPYKNNPYEFSDSEIERTQHFVPEISYILKINQGIFFLASFQAMIIPHGTAEEIYLSFIPDNSSTIDRIDANTPDLYTIRKLIELNESNISPSFSEDSHDNEISNPSSGLSDFLKD